MWDYPGGRINSPPNSPSTKLPAAEGSGNAFPASLLLWPHGGYATSTIKKKNPLHPSKVWTHSLDTGKSESFNLRGTWWSSDQLISYFRKRVIYGDYITKNKNGTWKMNPWKRAFPLNVIISTSHVSFQAALIYNIILLILLLILHHLLVATPPNYSHQRCLPRKEPSMVQVVPSGRIPVPIVETLRQPYHWRSAPFWLLRYSELLTQNTDLRWSDDQRSLPAAVSYTECYHPVPRLPAGYKER